MGRGKGASQACCGRFPGSRTLSKRPMQGGEKTGRQRAAGMWVPVCERSDPALFCAFRGRSTGNREARVRNVTRPKEGKPWMQRAGGRSVRRKPEAQHAVKGSTTAPPCSCETAQAQHQPRGTMTQAVPVPDWPCPSPVCRLQGSSCHRLLEGVCAGGLHPRSGTSGHIQERRAGPRA